MWWVGTHASFAICGGVHILVGFFDQHCELLIGGSCWAVVLIGNINLKERTKLIKGF